MPLKQRHWKKILTRYETNSIFLFPPQVEPFLYNKGRGRYIPIANLVKLRNCDRPRHKQLPDIRILENPEEDFDIEADCPDVG